MYEQFFGLKEEPFRLTPDSRYFYLSKRHMEALACLHYGIERHKGFIEVTGEIGSGKTTLCRSFLSQLKPTVKYALILNPRLSETQVLKTILNDFGIDAAGRSKKEYFDSLNTFLLEQNSQGNTVMVIIDEAQDLAPRVLEQIRLLSNLETETEKLLQIIFFGQPEFRELIRKPSLAQLRQRISIRYHLTALNPKETEEYVRHRLQVAGAQEESIVFTPKAFEVIYGYSRGIPRLINSLGDKILLAAYVQNTRHITYQIAETAVNEVEGTPVECPQEPAFESYLPEP